MERRMVICAVDSRPKLYWVGRHRYGYDSYDGALTRDEADAAGLARHGEDWYGITLTGPVDAREVLRWIN